MPREPHELGVFVHTTDYLPCPACRGTGWFNHPDGSREIHHLCSGTGVYGHPGEMSLDNLAAFLRGDNPDAT